MRTFARSCLIASLVASAHLPAFAYQVFRNVRDYGATGNGFSDDTAAIIKALTDQRGDSPSMVYPNATYSSSTQHPAQIYFPSGTYKITQTLPVIWYTQMVGDANNLPVIKFVSSSPNDQRVLEAMGSWFPDVNQNNFYRSIRNFVIDMTACTSCTGVHWQVSQATQITNVFFKNAIGSAGQGMFMENGSGGFFSDLVFEGGKLGMAIGNQQFTIRNITVRQTSQAGILMFWGWVWTFKGMHISDTPIGFDFLDGVGTVSIIDSDFTNIGQIGLRTAYDRTKASAQGSVVLDNVKFNVAPGTTLLQNAGGENALVANSQFTTIKAWAQGHVWGNGQNVNQEIDLSNQIQRNTALNALGSDSYFERTRPIYNTGDIVDVTTVGVIGDGVTDVSDALQGVFNKYANSKVLKFPHGTYIISKTVYVPAGTRMFGEVWSVLMASGAAFQNALQPTPMLQVGKPGESGQVEMADFMFSTYGPQPGAVIVEWNMRDAAGTQGTCGMWEVHFRIGGAVGTNIRNTNCPKGDGSSAPASVCTGAYALLHLTRSSSLYMENVWGWVADHDQDAVDQINVYNARGLLCESQGPVWMYGTGMEHSVLYQYNLAGASNVAIFTVQTETPYFQPTKNAPFDVLRTDPTDPTFCTDDFRCQMAYGLVSSNSNNVIVYGTGMYSFFDTWDQGCLQTAGGPNCQKQIAKIQGSHVNVLNLNTYGVIYVEENAPAYSAAASNLNTFCASMTVDLNSFN